MAIRRCPDPPIRMRDRVRRFSPVHRVYTGRDTGLAQILPAIPPRSRKDATSWCSSTTRGIHAQVDEHDGMGRPVSHDGRLTDTHQSRGQRSRRRG